MRDPEMVGLARLAAVPQYIREHVEQVVFRIARRAILSVISPTGDDQAENYQTAPTDPQGQVAARKFQHYGFRSAPPVRSEIIALSLGAKISNRVYVASEAPGVGPQAQTEGEVEVYSKFGHRIALRDNGSILFTDVDGTEMVWRSGRLYRHSDVYTGALPVALPGSADVTITTVVGSDSFFEVELAVVNQVVKGAALATVTFSTAFPSAPLALAVMRVGGKKITWSATSSAVTLTADEIMAPGPYTITVHVGGLG